jgi:very-short-patch-repair endonuclease
MVKAQRPTSVGRRLRRNSTDPEKHLWFRLRDRRLNGWKFRRQAPVAGYVADFPRTDARLIIEVDGGQHAVRAAADAARTEMLGAAGYLVLRFWNNDVLANVDGVLEEIIATLPPEPPHPNPLPDGERGQR